MKDAEMRVKHISKAAAAMFTEFKPPHQIASAKVSHAGAFEHSSLDVMQKEQIEGQKRTRSQSNKRTKAGKEGRRNGMNRAV